MKTTLKKQEKESKFIKIIAEDDGKILGRASLFLIYNDLHKEPYGFLEDVFVEEGGRGNGVGTALVKEIIEEAKRRGCYKLIATSRRGREKVHELYERLGFEDYGLEFRMNF